MAQEQKPLYQALSVFLLLHGLLGPFSLFLKKLYFGGQNSAYLPIFLVHDCKQFLVAYNWWKHRLHSGVRVNNCFLPWLIWSCTNPYNSHNLAVRLIISGLIPRSYDLTLKSHDFPRWITTSIRSRLKSTRLKETVSKTNQLQEGRRIAYCNCVYSHWGNWTEVLLNFVFVFNHSAKYHGKGIVSRGSDVNLHLDVMRLPQWRNFKC